MRTSWQAVAVDVFSLREKSDTASRARAMPHGKVTMNYLDVAVTVISIVEVVVVYSSPTLLAAWSLQGAVQKTLKILRCNCSAFFGLPVKQSDSWFWDAVSVPPGEITAWAGPCQCLSHPAFTHLAAENVHVNCQWSLLCPAKTLKPRQPHCV